MALSTESVETLMRHLNDLVGQTVAIYASLSRDRVARGHDRHCSTGLQFSLVVETIMGTIRGRQILIAAAVPTYYGMALDALVDWTREDDGTLVITEQFEAQTERRTEIVPAATMARRAAERAARNERLGISLNPPVADSDDPASPGLPAGAS